MPKKHARSTPAIAMLLVLPIASWPDAGQAQVEEITVTTRKREENLQEVPISISAIGAETIERLNLQDARDIARITPSLVFDTGFDQRDTRVVIRGLAPTRGRQNAALLVDGVDLTGETINAAGGSMFATRRVLDLERVEVVKGPQSALYGRSAFNGAVQYITRRPSLTGFEARTGIEIASDDRYLANASISGPAVEGVLGLGLSGQVYTSDGFYTAVNNGQSLGGEEGYAVAGSALWEPRSELSIYVRAEGAHDEFDPLAQVWTLPNLATTVADQVPGAVGIASSSTQYLYVGRVPSTDELRPPTHPDDPLTGKPYQGADRDLFRTTLIASWDDDWGTATSWTALADGDSGTRQNGNNGEGIFEGAVYDYDNIAMNTSHRSVETDSKLFSQELRYRTKLEGPVQFTVGGLYWKSEDDQSSNSLSRASCTSSQPACAAMTGEEAAASTVNADVDNDLWERDLTHWSAYGLVEWEFLPTWTFTAEARYTDEKEVVVGSNCADANYFDENGIIDENSPINRLRASLGLPVRIVTNRADIGSPTLGTCPFGPSSIVQGPGPDFVTYKGLGAPLRQTFNDDFIAPRFTLQWQPSDVTNVYLSAAEGIKPGGTSTVTAGTWFDSNFDGSVEEVHFDKEKLWSYELGLKQQWFDRTFQTNVAVFYQEYTDKQVGTQVITPSGQSVGKIENAGEAELKGVELETIWSPNENWTLSANYTYLDTEYTKFEYLTTSASAIIRAGNCTPTDVPNPATGGVSTRCLVDQSGHPLERAPEHSVYLDAQWTHPLMDTGLDVLAGVNGRYFGTRSVDPTELQLLRPSWLAEARLGITGDKWDVLLFCSNCFDSDEIVSASDTSNPVTSELVSGGTSAASAALVLANLPDPRVWGLRANRRF